MVPVILLSIAYGIALCALFALVTARIWYLIATRHHRHSVSKLSWLSTTFQEFIWPSQSDTCEEFQNFVGKIYGTLFGLTFTIFLFATKDSKTLNDTLDTYGLLAYPILPTIGVALTFLEVLSISLLFSACPGSFVVVKEYDASSDD